MYTTVHYIVEESLIIVTWHQLFVMLISIKELIGFPVKQKYFPSVFYLIHELIIETIEKLIQEECYCDSFGLKI